MKLIWSRLAQKRRLEIIRYISRDNREAARGMDLLFRKSAKSLVQFPRKGVVGRINGTRELTVHPNYILVYAISSDAIDIVTIVHTAQLFPASDDLQ